jgi:hypothetical protein
MPAPSASGGPGAGEHHKQIAEVGALVMNRFCR